MLMIPSNATLRPHKSIHDFQQNQLANAELRCAEVSAGHDGLPRARHTSRQTPPAPRSFGHHVEKASPPGKIMACHCHPSGCALSSHAAEKCVASKLSQHAVAAASCRTSSANRGSSPRLKRATELWAQPRWLCPAPGVAQGKPHLMPGI